jgi:hypothetical protein
MAWLTWLAVPFGAALILTSVLDVGLTVLHIQAESPFSVRINRALWGMLRALSAPFPGTTRDRLLAWGFPLMVASTVTLWVALYIGGFGLIYLPLIEQPGMFRPPSAGALHASDAFYFSAVSFLTIGYGDIAPAHWLMRLLSVLEGAIGLLSISLAVTYLLSVYPLVTRKQALAAALNQENDGRSDGVAVAVRFVGAGRFELIGSRLRALNDELLVLGQAHGIYPLLFYVRPRESQASFVRVLVVIQGLVCTLRYLLRSDSYAAIAEDPRLAAMEEGLLYTLHQLDRSKHIRPDEGSHDERFTLEQIERALRDLRAAGLKTVSLGDATARERIFTFRRATDPFILAYARNLSYPPDRIWAEYSRGGRDTELDDAS